MTMAAIEAPLKLTFGQRESTEMLPFAHERRGSGHGLKLEHEFVSRLRDHDKSGNRELEGAEGMPTGREPEHGLRSRRRHTLRE